MVTLIHHERCEQERLHMIQHDIWKQISLPRHDIRSHDGILKHEDEEHDMKMEQQYGTGLQ